MKYGNLGNSYERVLSPEFIAKCPKTVFAALAVSCMLTRNGESFETVERDLLEEWAILHDNGIVPQKAPTIKTQKA